MPSSNTSIRDYLAPWQPGFWRWYADAEAIVWDDGGDGSGGVLVFRVELAEVLERLAPQGLPPLSAVLLVMAAMKKSWGDGQRVVNAFSTLAPQFDVTANWARQPWREVTGVSNERSPRPADVERDNLQIASPDSNFAACERVKPGIALPPETNIGDLIPQVLVALSAVHEAARDLADDPFALAELPALLFTPDDLTLFPDTSRAVVEALRAAPEAHVLEPRSGEGAVIDFRNTLLFLRDQLADLSAEALRLRRETGLDDTIAPAEVDPDLPEPPPTPHRVRALIEQLRSDEQYAPVGRLARNLMAAVHLPRSVGDPEELPLGGVSDITNRGQLDRLLVSELAHDDLTLAVRIATNEALYLRREEPPATPPHSRHILLDVGLRMWGVPRVLATSLAMALCAATDDDAVVKVWSARGEREITSDALSPSPRPLPQGRGAGKAGAPGDAKQREADDDAGHGGFHDELVDADLTDRAGLVAQLARLDTQLDPIGLFDALAERIADDAPHATEIADVVVVTSAAAAEDSAFRQLMRDSLSPHNLYLAAVERDGAVTIAGVTPAGVKPLAKVRMDIDDVADVGEAKKKPQPLIDDTIDANLPAILKVKPFPLLLPHHVDARDVWRVGETGPTLAITGDGRLMLWRKSGVGAVELANDINHPTLHWHDPSPGYANLTMALVGSLKRPELQLLVIEPEDANVRRVELRPSTDQPVLGATAHANHVLLIYDDAIEAIDMSSGQSVGRLDMSKEQILQCRGRLVFCRHNLPRWHMVSAGGAMPHVEPVNLRGVNCVDCFESSMIDGPVVLDSDGAVFACDQEKPRRIGGTLLDATIERLMGVSSDGRRFAVWQRTKFTNPKACVYELKNGDEISVVDLYPADAWRTLQEHALANITDRTLRVKLKGAFIAISSTTGLPQLGLVTRRGNVLLTCDAAGRELRLEKAEGARPQWHSFESIPSPGGARYKLRAAKWSDGSRAVLDSRGLLHLQSADPAVPETTIALDDHHISGWVSDGRIFGDRYYHDSNDPADVVDVYKHAIEPFLQRAR